MSTLNISKNLEDKIKQVVLDYFYPVGSLYITMKTGLPDTYLGGKWEKVAVGKTLFGASNITELGQEIVAGLPNITGYVDPRWHDSSGGGIIMGGDRGGALYTSRPDHHGYWWAATDGANGNPGQNTQYHTRIEFDASYNNSIYGKSNTVQPPAVKVFFWKRIA